MSDPTSVYICDPHPIVVEGLRKVLSTYEDFTMAGASASLAEALQAARSLQPKIVLADSSFGLRPISQFIRELQTVSACSWTILWAVESTESGCIRALRMGLRGVLPKTLDIPSLLDCLRTVRSGSVWVPESDLGPRTRGAPSRITLRERDIIARVCRGLRNRDIATELAITPGTVKVHLMHIFEKTGVRGRLELALRGRRLVGGVSSPVNPSGPEE